MTKECEDMLLQIKLEIKALITNLMLNEKSTPERNAVIAGMQIVEKDIINEKLGLNND